LTGNASSRRPFLRRWSIDERKHDVEQDEDHDDRDAADDVPRVLPQRLPEDREVVRHEERRDRDRDDVIEHLCPRGSERDQLVEGVAGKARRAARLGITDCPLGVCRRRGSEDQAADDEDERRQPEGDPCHEPEGVVDRRADVAVRRREQRRGPEDTLEALLTPPPTWSAGGAWLRRGHAGRLVPLPVMPPRFWVASTKPGAALARSQG